MNPLQALFNCIVYKRWRRGDKVKFPWTSNNPEDIAIPIRQASQENVDEHEREPLLRSQPSAINGYKSYD